MKSTTQNDYWAQHLTTWKDSGLSQNAYCQQNGIKSYQFSYWKRKLNRDLQPPPPIGPDVGKPFIPLSVSKLSPMEGLTIHFPNGCRVAGIEDYHISLVAQLAEVLR